MEDLRAADPPRVDEMIAISSRREVRCMFGAARAVSVARARCPAFGAVLMQVSSGTVTVRKMEAFARTRRRLVALAPAAVLLLVAQPAGADSGFSPPKSISPVSAKVSGVGIDDEGDSIVIWLLNQRVHARIVSADGTPGSPIPISLPGRNVSVFARVATDADGDSIVAWTSGLGTTAEVFARQISSTGMRGPIIRIAHGAYMGG